MGFLSWWWFPQSRRTRLRGRASGYPKRARRIKLRRRRR